MRRLAVLAVAAAALPLAFAHGSPPSARCDQRAVASLAGSAARPSYRGVACSTSTGYAAAESHLNVLPNGTLVYTPAVLPHGTLGIGQLPGDVAVSQSNASPGALAMSGTGGRSWVLVKPDGITWNPTDHGDFVDPVTGRLFFESYGPIPLNPAYGPDQEGPSHMLMSPDGGKTWKHTVIRDTQITENAQFAAGVVPRGSDRPTGYPRVTYFCSNITIGFTSPVIAQRSCYRSLDGGVSWATRSVILRSSAPVHNECLPYGENLSALDGHYPQAAPDGSLYLMLSCGPFTFLAKSTDEALTFPVLRNAEGPRTVPIPQAPVPDFNTSALQVLSDGTLVVLSLENDRLRVLVSGNEGRTWSRAVDVSAPGVASVSTWAVASRGTAVSLAYYAKHPGDKRYYGYVALLPNPRSLLRGNTTPLVTGQVRKDPLLFGDSPLGGPGVSGAGTIPGPGGTHLPFPFPFTAQDAGNDFLGAALGPDGTPWGSFNADCGPTADSPGCVSNGGQTRGVVGRLVLH